MINNDGGINLNIDVIYARYVIDGSWVQVQTGVRTVVLETIKIS